MNSVTQTGAVSATAVTLAPYFQWALDGFPHSAPQGLALLLAAAAITAAHGAYVFAQWKFTKPKQESAPHA